MQEGSHRGVAFAAAMAEQRVEKDLDLVAVWLEEHGRYPSLALLSNAWG
jgi:hypothetical protein